MANESLRKRRGGDAALRKGTAEDGRPEIRIQAVHGVTATIQEGGLHVAPSNPIDCPLP
jgi:hypothetical protein